MNLTQVIASGAIPVLVSLLSSPKWPGGVRASFAFALCVGLALWQAHGQFGPDVIENVLKVFALVQALYLGLLKHIGLPALEKGSAEAWRQFLKALTSGFTTPPCNTKERLQELNDLLEAKVISQSEFNQRRTAILEDV